MAKAQELCLPGLDDLVKDYAEGVVGQASGVWQQCDAMRQALLAGDVDTGLAILGEVCPAALKDVRLVFRAKKQKFVELLRTSGDPEAALVCARAELAPLALDAYPEAYVEFKRLLLLLLLVPPPDRQQKCEGQQRQEKEVEGKGRPAGSMGLGSGGVRGGGGRPFCGLDTAGLCDAASTVEFADLAYFTVRSMLGLQQPLLSLQLRFLLRLYGSYPAAAGSTPGGAAASELAPRLRAAGGGGGDRDPPPLPPAAPAGSGGRGGGGGGGPPCFPESGVQAVIHGAGTSRQAAVDALKRSGGDTLSAFKAEVGRLRLNEQLLAELALEYGRFRGLLSAQQSEALEARAAGGMGGDGGGERGAALVPPAAAADPSQGQLLDPPQQQPQQVAVLGPLHGQQQLLQQSGSGPGPGPLGLARGDASRTGCSPPNKLARRSPPTEGEGADGGDGSSSGPQQTDVEMGLGGGGQRSMRSSEAVAARDGEPAGGERAGAASSSFEPESGSDSKAGSGSGSGPGSSSGASQRPRGQEVMSTLLRLGQEGDAAGVLSLVDSVDPQLWAEHPHLLFDVRRCQYGKLLAEGEVTAALELARRELTPLANANPALLPLLKSAMAALLPPLPAQSAAPSAAPPPPLFRSFLPPIAGAQPAPPPPSAAATAAAAAGPSTATSTAGSAAGSALVSASGCASPLLPSLPAVVGAIQAVLQPRLGLQGPRLVRLMEGLLASHRAWMRAEKMSSDPFAEAMKITALRASPAAAAAAGATAATAAVPTHARQPSAAAGGLAPSGAPPPPPPPLPVGVGAGLGAAARALERVLREAGVAERGLMQPWYEMEQQILAQMHPPPPHGRDLRRAPGGGPLYGVFPGMPGLGHGDDDDEGHGAGGGGGGAGGMPPDDGDDDDDGSGGGGMDVDEEGVLRLMEILELPRGAAVELLQNHDNDVQAAILSVMQ